MVYHGHVEPGSKLLHGLKPSPELLVGVDIGIVEKTVYLEPLALHDLKGIDGAGTAADMQ
jgi:hypothetical protein